MRGLGAILGAMCAAVLCLAGPASAQAGAAGARGSARAGAGGATPAPAQAQRKLARTLGTDLKHAHGSSGALVVNMTSGQTLYRIARNTSRLPASVEKLFTTSTALLQLGPNANLVTSVLGVGSLDLNGIWHGTLYLRGGGDPTFGSQSFDASMYGSGTGATVQRLVANLVRAGIHGVRGRIVGDESWFDSLRGTPSSAYAPDTYLEGQLSGLAFNRGLQNGVFQRRPALYAAQQFAAALRAAHVSVPRRTRVYTGRTPAAATALAVVHSPRLATLLRLTNAPSDNFFAEMLLKDLGARLGTGGTTAAGAAVVRASLAQKLGISPLVYDGSGLSRADFTTPTQVVALLQQMSTNLDFVDSLAVAGQTGTMAGEMLHSRAAGNCRGKTGTLSDVANLVGYCTDRRGDLLAFAFLMNRLGNSYLGHAMEDKMGVALANYNG